MKRLALFPVFFLSLIFAGEITAQNPRHNEDSLTRKISQILNDPYVPEAVYFAGVRVPLEEGTVRGRIIRAKLQEAIRRFTATFAAHQRTAGYLVEMSYYEQYFDSAFAANGKSRDYANIAIIESGLNSRARSRAGAMSFWQLMRGTGRDCGLRIGRRIDERKNLDRSTRCAIRYLNFSDSIFHDPFLNAAAFNVGNVHVQEAIGANQSSSFFDLVFVKSRGQFNTETMNYPYNMIAMMLIRAMPERYFFRIVKADDPDFAISTYEVRRRTTLIGLAHQVGIAPAVFLNMNPQFETNIIPPGRYILVVPRVNHQIIPSHG